jgi:hypothetical protein
VLTLKLLIYTMSDGTRGTETMVGENVATKFLSQEVSDLLITDVQLPRKGGGGYRHTAQTANESESNSPSIRNLRPLSRSELPTRRLNKTRPLLR